jgi:hypothetical protein
MEKFKKKLFLLNTTAPSKSLNQNKDCRAWWVERAGTAHMRSQLGRENKSIKTRGYLQIKNNMRVFTN